MQTEIIVIPLLPSQLVIDHAAREWCKMPYPDHPDGCPNYGKKDECPPYAPYIEQWMDFRKGCQLVVCKFDIGDFERRMKEKHPKWTDKQARCCLYWQESVRKALREKCREITNFQPELQYTLLPEAMGVQVIRTLLRLGIPIKTHPKDAIYKVGLISYANVGYASGLKI